jgi:hypothetical protein
MNEDNITAPATTQRLGSAGGRIALSDTMVSRAGGQWPGSGASPVEAVASAPPGDVTASFDVSPPPDRV